MNKTLLTFAVASIAFAATSASAAITSNALSNNGLQLNGLHVNGVERNALSNNGASASGQKLMIQACDQKQVQLCEPRPGLRVLSVTLPSEAVVGAAMERGCSGKGAERGGSTKGTCGYNGISLTGFACKRPEGAEGSNGVLLTGVAGERGGSTKGTGGCNGVSLTGIAGR